MSRSRDKRRKRRAAHPRCESCQRALLPGQTKCDVCVVVEQRVAAKLGRMSDRAIDRLVRANPRVYRRRR